MATVTHQPVRPIKQEQVNRMLRLQQLFHERYLTADLLNQLVATYVDAIQCFDGFYSPMRKYFLNKIQYVVSQPEIDSMLKRNVQTDNMVGMLRQTIRMTTQADQSQEIFSQQRLMQAIQAQNKKSRQIYQNNLKANKLKQKSSNNFNEIHTKYPDRSLDKNQQKKGLERDKKIEMQMNFMKEVAQNMKNLQTQVELQDKKFQKKNKRINALMVEQNDSLEARLAMRKRGKNRKRSGDQKYVQQVQEVIPFLNKQQLKEAQKEIANAVERMTQRLTQRMSSNRGVTGMIISSGVKQNGNDEKHRGRIKLRNQVREEENQDEDFQEFNKPNSKKNDNPQFKQDKVQNQTLNKSPPKTDNRTSNGTGTARFTLAGGQTGGRGRIKRRDTNRLEENDDVI